MSEQLELTLPVEQSKTALRAKDSLEKTKLMMHHAEELHEILMKAMRDQIRSLTTEFQKNCTHPNTVIQDDFDYHKREDWKEEICKECGLVLRRW